MSSPHERDFGDFDSLLSKWKGAYVCAVYSYVGVKTAEGPHLLYGRILLEPSRSGIDETLFTFETEHVVAGRFVRSTTTEDLVVLIEKAGVGKMDRFEGIVSLAAEAGRPFSTYFAPIYHPFVSDGPRLPSLRVHGIAKHNLLVTGGDARQIDWEMRAADIPFDTLDELLGHCLLPPLAQSGDRTTLEIVARTPGTIGVASIITGGEAVIECRVARALDLGKVRVGYRILDKSQRIDRGSVTGDAFEWRDESDLRVASHRVLVGEASLLEAFLSYDRVPLHHWWITDPEKRLNPRDAIHQVFDQDQEVLRRMVLTPETDKPYAFEAAVSTLLSLLGFSVANYGRIPKLQRGPDIIAFSPLGHVAIIECTVGLLDENDKLAKLVQRTQLIKDKLAKAGYGHLELQAAIVTPLPRNEVVAHLATAGEHGICVVCKEDLERLLSQVRLFPNAERMLQDAKRLIPGSSQQSLFPQ